MKKAILFLSFVLLITSSALAQTQDTGISSEGIVIILVVAIAHICITAAVYKIKGGAWACIYFFLAPVALLLIFLALESKSNSNRKDIHHHFH